LFNINSIISASYGRIFDFEAKVEKFNTRHVFFNHRFQTIFIQKTFFFWKREGVEIDNEREFKTAILCKIDPSH